MRKRTVQRCNSDDPGAYPVTSVVWAIKGKPISAKAYYRVVMTDYPHTSARYRSYTHTITLPEWARQLAVVLHETAHSKEGHGPVFMRKYIDLLVKYDVFTESELLDSALAAGLRVA